MPIGGEHEPVPPAPVDADAAIVRVILVRQRDVGPRVVDEPEPGAGEQRVAGGVEALPQHPRGVGLVPNHQVTVAEEHRGGGRRGARHVPRHGRTPEGRPGLRDAQAAGEDLQRGGGEVGDDDPVPDPERGAGARHPLEAHAQEAVDAGARSEEAQLEVAVLGHQCLVPGNARAGEDGVCRRSSGGGQKEEEKAEVRRRPPARP